MTHFFRNCNFPRYTNAAPWTSDPQGRMVSSKPTPDSVYRHDTVNPGWTKTWLLIGEFTQFTPRIVINCSWNIWKLVSQLPQLLNVNYMNWSTGGLPGIPGEHSRPPKGPVIHHLLQEDGDGNIDQHLSDPTSAFLPTHRTGPSMLSYRSKSWIRKNTGKKSREKNVFRSIWPAPTFEQFFIFGISSCIWSPQIGQTLSGHEGWNQRKNAKGQLVESMPITSISPVYPIDLSYPPEMVGFIPLLVLYPYWIPIWIGLEDAVPSMAMICNGAAKTQLHKAVETKWNIGCFLDSDIPRLGYKKKWTTMEDVPYRRVLVGGSAHLILTYI